MSCLPALNRVPAGYALNDPLPHSTPKATWRKVMRLVILAQSTDAKVRAAAAGNPMTPRVVLLEMVDDDSLLVRSWLARNPQCPREVLETLASDDGDVAAYARWKLSDVAQD